MSFFVFESGSGIVSPVGVLTTTALSGSSCTGVYETNSILGSTRSAPAALDGWPRGGVEEP
jgi:hypothetical protein